MVPVLDGNIPDCVGSMLPVLDGYSELGAHVRGQSLLFDLFKAFDYIKSCHKSDFFSEKIFLHACASRFGLPSDISTTDGSDLYNTVKGAFSLGFINRGINIISTWGEGGYIAPRKDIYWVSQR